jgi:hypothetical protein
MQLGENKFEAKLSFAERCQMLALRHAGMSIGAVAIAFNVNRRTVTHIHNERSPRYHNVRAHRDDLGEEAFLTKYLTEDVVERVKAAAMTTEAQATYAAMDKLPGSAKAGVPNPRATSNAGVSVHKGPNHGHSHRIQVAWVAEATPPGWYSKLLDVDGIDSTEWGGDPEAMSHLTSSTAMLWARKYLNENY